MLLSLNNIDANTLNKTSTVNKHKYKIIKSNGIPPHKLYNLKHNNSYKIKSQKYNAKIPLLPKINPKPIPIKNYVFGITTTGIIIDSTPIKYWLNKPALKWGYNYFFKKNNSKIDSFNGYINKYGEYHYKGIPQTKNKFKAQQLIGYAADGIPIYNDIIRKKNNKLTKLKPSYKIKKGYRPSGPSGKYNGLYNKDYIYIKNSGDLDICNGKFGKTKEYKNGTYYYVLTSSYPYIPRCFRGRPDHSFTTLKKQYQKPKKQFMRNSNY
tara:strand:- start:166 stop:963 length:798 start_codon:yes stop_codon:yes gene_type:complete